MSDAYHLGLSLRMKSLIGPDYVLQPGKDPGLSIDNKCVSKIANYISQACFCSGEGETYGFESQSTFYTSYVYQCLHFFA